MKFISKYRYYILMLVGVGFLTYLHSLFNGFAWDDLPFILENRVARGKDFWGLIGPNLFNSGLFYRPIVSVYFEAMYSLFGTDTFFYHAIQVALHSVNTILLFAFFMLFFSAPLALFLALIFLIHPMNVESVAFIQSTTGVLSFLFGMSAFLLGTTTHQNRKRVIAIGLLVLLSVLSKETGILFLPMILLYRYVYKKDKLKTVVGIGIIDVLVYMYLRVYVAGVSSTGSTPLTPLRELSFIERVVNIPAVFMYYLQTFVIPWKLSIWQLWIKTATVQDFVVPLFIGSALLIGLGMWIKSSHTKTRQRLIFFASWYAVGMVLILQIFPIDMTVADRWFYFPMVGLLGVIGIALQSLITTHKKHKKTYLTFAVLIVILLYVRTFIRILDWKDNLTILTHDADQDPTNYVLMGAAGLALHQNDRTEEGLVYVEKSVARSPNIINLSYLGTMYLSTKEYDKAISAFKRLIRIAKSSRGYSTVVTSEMASITDIALMKSYINLSAAYYFSGNPSEGSRVAEEGIKKFPTVAQLYTGLAITEIKIGNTQKALSAIKKSYELAPDTSNTYIYNQLRQGLPIDESIIK